MKLNKYELIVKNILESNFYAQNIVVYETAIITTILDNIKAHIHNYVNVEPPIIDNNEANPKKTKAKGKLTYQETLKLARACNRKPLPKKCLLRRAKKTTTTY